MVVIRCAMFDYGNVLAHFDNPRFYSFLKEHSGNSLEPHEIFTGKGRVIMDDYYRGGISDLDLFIKIQNLFELKDVRVLEFFRMFNDVMELDQQMLRVKNKLAERGIITVLITNIGRHHLDYIKRNYPLLLPSFDYRFISCDEGIIKPDPEAWIRPLEYLGLKAEECIFIDDHLPNIEEARKLGIKAWHHEVTDNRFYSTGRLREEVKRFEDFLALLDSLGLLYDKNKTR